jgi:hypothetical protein
MAKTRAELDAMLDTLQKVLPKMIADNPEDGDFWAAFAGDADCIVDATSEADCAHVRGRLDCMLQAQGLIPGDDSVTDCS